MVHLERKTWVITPTAPYTLFGAKANRDAFGLASRRPHPDRAHDGRPIDGTLWLRVLEEIQTRVNRYAFTTWFAETRMVDDDNATVTVCVSDALTAEWLRSRYADILVGALESCGRSGVAIALVPADVAES